MGAKDRTRPGRTGPAAAQEPIDLAGRIGSLDWPKLGLELDEEGCAVAPGLLTRAECESIAALDAEDERFRSRIVMARHNFGRGTYGYFAHPLPALVLALRTALYPHLAPLANHWNAALRSDTRFPAEHAAFLERCHAAGQTRPTPLLLSYRKDDYNRLHQDLYGEHVFPLQVAILLCEPGRDFTGGELVLTEQRPRAQSRAIVLAPRQGDAVIFAVRERPVQGARGPTRVQMRHGVSRLRSGRRLTLGILFHDAR